MIRPRRKGRYVPQMEYGMLDPSTMHELEELAGSNVIPKGKAHEAADDGSSPVLNPYQRLQLWIIAGTKLRLESTQDAEELNEIIGWMRHECWEWGGLDYACSHVGLDPAAVREEMERILEGRSHERR